MPRMNPGHADAGQESVQAAAEPAYREVIADVDSEIVTIYRRRLHAEWEEDVERLEQAKVAIDVLLERRFKIMQAQAAEAA